ncbi:MAG TPA: hypothetical protein VKP03_01680 [Patescibacteria group bacterium]|nr:hypothetical protein [Patescibacteria group bacterium]
MNTLSRTITGTIAIIFGTVFLVSAFIKTYWMLLIYGIPIFIIGFFILFNKKEDKIEQIKSPKNNINNK